VAILVDVRPKRHATRVHLQDRFAAGAVGRLHGDSPVEPAGAKQRLVEHVGAVGGADDDHAGGRVETVHLGQDLVQRLLALVVAAAEAGNAGRAGPADRIELVDEHDRRSGLFRLREEIAHARCADADDRLHELRGRHREERDIRLAGDRTGEERLAGAGWAREQYAVRDPAAEFSVLVGMTEEVDDLGQLLFCLIDPGDVGERDAVAGRLIPAGARASERAENVLNVPRAAHQPEQEEDEEDRRPEPEQKALPPGRARVQRLSVHGHLVLLQHPRQRVRVRERRNLRLEAGRRLRPRVPLLLRERSLDRRPLRGDLLDMTRGHLLQEERAIRNPDTRAWLRRPGAEVEVERQEPEEEGDPHAARAEARRLRRCRRGAARRRGWARLGAPIVPRVSHRTRHLALPGHHDSGGMVAWSRHDAELLEEAQDVLV
jgi:hypothetical protein